MYFFGTLPTDVFVLADKQELIYISSVKTKNENWKTCWEQWIIGMVRERKRERERERELK